MLDALTVAARLRTLADRVHRLEGISHRRPHAFLEGKDEIARAMEDLASEILKPAARAGNTPSLHRRS